MDKIKNISLKVRILFRKESDFYVAYCPALELSGYGYNKSDAKKSFSENLDIFLEEVNEKGTLDKVLLNLGWSLRKKPQPKFIPPAINSSVLRSYSNSVGYYSSEKIVKVPV
jgi:hypothetical protein